MTSANPRHSASTIRTSSCADDDDARRARHRARDAGAGEFRPAGAGRAAAPAAQRRFRWGTVFWSALGGLVALGAGLATTRADRGPLRARDHGSARSAPRSPRSRCLRCWSSAHARSPGCSASPRSRSCARAPKPRIAQRRPRRGARDRARTDRHARPRRRSSRAAAASSKATSPKSSTARDLLHIAERSLMAPLDREASQPRRPHRDARLGRHRGLARAPPSTWRSSRSRRSA